MKIAWLCPYNITKGSISSIKVNAHTSSWIMNLSQELLKNINNELHIITISSKIVNYQRIQENNLHIHIVPSGIPFIRKGYPWWFPVPQLTSYARVSRKILQLLNSIKPDVVHAHGTEGPYGLIASRCAFPAVISIQGIIEEYYMFDKNLSFRLQIPIERKSICNNRHFGCRTDWDKNHILQINPSAIVHYMPEAIAYPYFENTWKAYANHDVVFVGNIIPRKGLQVLFKSIAQLKHNYPDIRLHIIGGSYGNFIHKLRQLAIELKITDNLLWHDKMNPQQIAGIMTESAIYVLPTYIDNSPNSLAEAMAIGMPCIASDTGGIPSMIQDGHDGLLATTGDEQSVAEKIHLLFENSNRMHSLAANAKKTARKRNYPPDVAAITMQVYKDLLS